MTSHIKKVLILPLAIIVLLYLCCTIFIIKILVYPPLIVILSLLFIVSIFLVINKFFNSFYIINAKKINQILPSSTIIENKDITKVILEHIIILQNKLTAKEKVTKNFSENYCLDRECQILIVDDEPMIIRVLTNYLSLKKYKVIIANDGNEALENIANYEKKGNPIDLVLLDVMMPGLSGYEVCKKIRDKYPPNELPVLILTAKSKTEDLIAGFDSGANDYITKPFSKDELLARVDTQLHLRLLFTDMATVINAGRAISGEIVLENLLKKVMSSIMENAKAEKAFLLLMKDKNLYIAAKRYYNENVSTENLPLEQCKELCSEIVHHVCKFQIHLVFDNASKEKIFENNEYIQRIKPKSILCIPILNKGHLMGILYLENNITKKAFTSDRVEILKLISCQAAISIENATIYQQLDDLNRTLEQKVEDRTRELSKSEEKYRGLYNSCKDGIVFLNLKYMIQDANDAFCEMTGYNIVLLREMTVKELIKDKLLKSEVNNLKKQIFLRGFSNEYEAEFLRKDQTTIPISFRAWLIKGEKNQPVGIWGICRDISEKKRAERIREDVERMVRHDLKTPLNAVIGLSKKLVDSDNLNDDQCKWSSIINENGKQILYMVEHSLDVFKMEEGIYELNPVKCDLISIFRTLDQAFAEYINERNIKIQYKLDNLKLKNNENICWWVYGEKILLQNMFANLIKNAIEASPENRIVTIDIFDTKYHNITIHNWGVIPEEIRDTFFDKYISRKKQGTGLGTYNAMLIAKVHGGNISFTSTKKQGTLIHVIFPQKNVKNFLKDTLDNKEILKQKLSSLKILIAEDNPNNEILIELFLEAININPEIVKNGKDALEKFKTDNIDIILMDIQMPVMNGVEAIKQIRSYEKKFKNGKKVPIIVMSADSSIAIQKNCIKAGCTDFISKPLNENEFYSALDKICSG